MPAAPAVNAVVGAKPLAGAGEAARVIAGIAVDGATANVMGNVGGGGAGGDTSGTASAEVEAEAAIATAGGASRAGIGGSAVLRRVAAAGALATDATEPAVTPVRGTDACAGVAVG